MLDSLRNQGCRRCPLHEGVENVCILGRGNSQASLFIVGEAPGEREDTMGLPFVGPAGKLLDQVLNDSGIGTEDVYITNSVKCRPPDNRKPKPEEEEACRFYLLHELWAVSPRAIVALGNHALRTTTGKWGITKERGRWHESHLTGAITNVPVFATFHPAYILRDLKNFETWLLDFMQLGKELIPQ